MSLISSLMKLGQLGNIYWNTFYCLYMQHLYLYPLKFSHQDRELLKGYLSPPVLNAWWAHMHHFVSVCLSVHLWLDRNSVDNNSNCKKYLLVKNLFLKVLCLREKTLLTGMQEDWKLNDISLILCIYFSKLDFCRLQSSQRNNRLCSPLPILLKKPK